MAIKDLLPDRVRWSIYRTRSGPARRRQARLSVEAMAHAATDLPWLTRLPAAAGHHRARLRTAHASYVSEVSTPVMAISLESAGCLSALCELLQPHAVAELGSGFSTYAIATAAPEARVVSTDDSPTWLEATRRFLEARGAGRCVELVPPDRFAVPAECPLVFLDFAMVDQRLAWFDHIFERLTPGGVVLIDDTHFADYRAEIVNRTAAAGGETLSLFGLTNDRIGRFQTLAWRPRSP